MDETPPSITIRGNGDYDLQVSCSDHTATAFGRYNGPPPDRSPGVLVRLVKARGDKAVGEKSYGNGNIAVAKWDGNNIDATDPVDNSLVKWSGLKEYGFTEEGHSKLLLAAIDNLASHFVGTPGFIKSSDDTVRYTTT